MLRTMCLHCVACHQCFFRVLKSTKLVLSREEMAIGIKGQPSIALDDLTPHDLRRTAASFMTSLGVNRVTVGKILNHADASVTAVYDRHGYDQEKRHALEAWATRLVEIIENKPSPSNVVSLAAGNDKS